LKAAVLMTITCSDPSVRRSLSSVLAPDNEEAPENLRISMRGGGRRLVLLLECDSPSTSVSAALAVLRDVTLFQEVWLLSRGKDAGVQKAKGE
jgi:hypothetical protein